MATNYVQKGDVLTLAAPYDRSSGQGALIGNLFGVATKDVLSGADGEFALTGVWTLAKNPTSEAWSTLGALIYWDNTNKRCTTSATGNTRIGCVAKTAGASDATGVVRLTGAPAPTGA